MGGGGGGFQCRVEGFWRKLGGTGGWVGFEMFIGKHGFLHYVAGGEGYQGIFKYGEVGVEGGKGF